MYPSADELLPSCTFSLFTVSEFSVTEKQTANFWVPSLGHMTRKKWPHQAVMQSQEPVRKQGREKQVKALTL